MLKLDNVVTTCNKLWGVDKHHTVGHVNYWHLNGKERKNNVKNKLFYNFQSSI